MRVFLLGATPSFDQTSVLSSAQKLLKTGGNSGNQLIAYGLLKTISYDSVSWDYSLGPEHVTESYDIIVIAAANFLHKGFDFSGMASFIERTNLPCVMVGVGAQSKDYNINIELHPGTTRLMHLVSERSHSIGVRGQYTAECLNAIGIKNLQLTGCPSYYMPGRDGFCVRAIDRKDIRRIAFNSSRDVIAHSFNASQMRDSVEYFMRIGVTLGADFVAQSELDEISLADHSKSFSDANALSNFLGFYKQAASDNALRDFARTHLRVFWDVARWIESMQSYDFVFGHRFHGCMAALQAGTPSCIVCHDTRTSEMCEFLGMPHVSLLDKRSMSFDNLVDIFNDARPSERYRVLYPYFRNFLVANGLSPVAV